MVGDDLVEGEAGLPGLGPLVGERMRFSRWPARRGKMDRRLLGSSFRVDVEATRQGLFRDYRIHALVILNVLAFSAD